MAKNGVKMWSQTSWGHSKQPCFLGPWAHVLSSGQHPKGPFSQSLFSSQPSPSGPEAGVSPSEQQPNLINQMDDEYSDPNLNSPFPKLHILKVFNSWNLWKICTFDNFQGDSLDLSNCFYQYSWRKWFLWLLTAFRNLKTSFSSSVISNIHEK